MKTIDLSQATQEQIDRTNRLLSIGAKMSFNDILAMEMKKDIKKGWRPMTAKDIKKMEQQERVDNIKELNLMLDGVSYGSDISGYNEAVSRKMMSVR